MGNQKIHKLIKPLEGPDISYDRERKILYHPRTKKYYPVEEVPKGLRLGRFKFKID